MQNNAHHNPGKPGTGGFIAVLLAAALFGCMGYTYVSVKARQHALAEACAESEQRMEELRTEITVLQRERGELLAVSHLERRLAEADPDLAPIRRGQIETLAAPDVPPSTSTALR